MRLCGRPVSNRGAVCHSSCGRGKPLAGFGSSRQSEAIRPTRYSWLALYSADRSDRGGAGRDPLMTKKNGSHATSVGGRSYRARMRLIGQLFGTLLLVGIVLHFIWSLIGAAVAV